MYSGQTKCIHSWILFSDLHVLFMTHTACTVHPKKHVQGLPFVMFEDRHWPILSISCRVASSALSYDCPSVSEECGWIDDMKQLATNILTPTKQSIATQCSHFMRHIVNVLVTQKSYRSLWFVSHRHCDRTLFIWSLNVTVSSKFRVAAKDMKYRAVVEAKGHIFKSFHRKTIPLAPDKMWAFVIHAILFHHTLRTGGETPRFYPQHIQTDVGRGPVKTLLHNDTSWCRES